MGTENIERTTPLGLARYAYEYMDAAIIVDDATVEKRLPVQASYTPAYFLASHSIELSLKAFLLFKGNSLELLRKKYKHNISLLYDAAIKQGLDSYFDAKDCDINALKLLAEINKEHQLRYIQTGYKQFPLFSIVETLGVRLHQAVTKALGCGKTFTISYTNCD